MDTAVTSAEIDARSDFDQFAASDDAGPRRRARARIAVIGVCVAGSIWLLVAVVIEAERHAGIEHPGLIAAIGTMASVMLGGLGLLLAFEIRLGSDRDARLTREQARADTQLPHRPQVRQRLP